MERDKTFYYTDGKMVKDLLLLLPISETDSVLDAGSGKNKAWFNNLNVKEKYECEIEDGCDFLNWNKKVDWIIGNPPFRNNDKDGKRKNMLPIWIEHASDIANKGMGFLVNHKIFNFLTPVRLEKLKRKNFELSKLHIVSDRRWFGRYYFLVFEKKGGILSWNKHTY